MNPQSSGCERSEGGLCLCLYLSCPGSQSRGALAWTLRTHSKLWAEELAWPYPLLPGPGSHHTNIPQPCPPLFGCKPIPRTRDDRWASFKLKACGRWRVELTVPPQGAPSSTPHLFCLPTAVQFPPRPRGPGDDRLALPQIQALLSSCMFGGNKAPQAK